MSHSLSTSGETKSTLIATPSVAGGTATRAIDATEDRTIVGVNWTFEDVGETEAHNIEGELFLGNDPFADADYQNDNEQFAMSFDYVQRSDGTGPGMGVPTLTEFFSTGFPWDEHVTLTLEHTENGTNSQSEAIVYWV